MEQRCRNKPSPRLAASVSFIGAGAAVAGLLCARNEAVPATAMEAKDRTTIAIDLVFKMSLSSCHRSGTSTGQILIGSSVLPGPAAVKK